MTRKINKRIIRIARYIYRNYKSKVYAGALVSFSILPAMFTEDISWLVPGMIICTALFMSDDEE